jgi:hypothetical protein
MASTLAGPVNELVSDVCDVTVDVPDFGEAKA